MMKKVLILTVGGSHEPVVKSIRDNKPDYIVFLCSDDLPTTKGSYIQITERVEVRDKTDPSKKSFLPGIPSQCNLKDGSWECVKIKDFDNLNDCYQISKKKVTEIRLRLNPDKIVIDYTGGTKSMTAGLASAALDDGTCEFVLVAGTRANLDKVTDKTEYIRPIAVYDTLANKNLALAESLLARFDFSGAINLLESSIKLSLSNEKNQEIQTYLNICKGFDAWDRFDHVSAYQYLNPYRKYFVDYVIPLEKIKTDVENNVLSYIIAEDILFNAERRANQGRYEDAIGRIYRSLELVAQIRLKVQYNQDTGNIALGQLSTLREEFKTKLEKHRNEENKIQIGLMQGYELLSELNDPVIHPWHQKCKNRIKDFLKYRNESLFAHGLKAIACDVYNNISPAIIELLRQLIDSLYKTDKKKRIELIQFPNDLKSIGNSMKVT